MKNTIKKHLTELFYLVIILATTISISRNLFFLFIISSGLLVLIISLKNKEQIYFGKNHPLETFVKPIIETMINFGIIINFLNFSTNKLFLGFFLFLIFITHTLTLITDNNIIFKKISFILFRSILLFLTSIISYLLLDNSPLIIYIITNLAITFFCLIKQQSNGENNE